MSVYEQENEALQIIDIRSGARTEVPSSQVNKGNKKRKGDDETHSDRQIERKKVCLCFCVCMFMTPSAFIFLYEN